MTPPINTLPEGTLQTPGEQPGKMAQILAGTRLAILAAVVAGGTFGKPQEVQAQETGIQAESAVFILPVALEGETLTDEDIAKMEEAIPRFNADLQALTAEERQIAGVDFSQIIDGFDRHQKQRVIGLYIAGMNVSEAVNQVYYSSLERTPDTVRMIHAQAIEIGLRDLELHLKQDPELSGMSEQDYKDYAIELMDTFLAGQEAWVIEDLVRYAPAFSNYVSQFQTDFILAEGVRAVISTAEAEANIAEAEARIDETEARTIQIQAEAQEWLEIKKALDDLSETLQANS